MPNDSIQTPDILKNDYAFVRLLGEGTNGKTWLAKHLSDGQQVAVKVMKFALAENLDEVKRTVKKMRLPGFHFYDELRWEGKAFLDYHVSSTPTVFVLDKDKMIVCKPYDWKELKEWLRLNNLKN